MLATKILASASVFSKLISGAGVFIITGYFVSPDSLGRLAVYMAYTTLMCLVADYGLQNPALREISIEPTRAAAIFNRYTLFRIFLFPLTFLATAAILLAGGSLGMSDMAFFTCLAAATFFGAHGDFTQIFFRGMGKYTSEAWISVITGVFHLLLVGLTAWWFRDVEYIGVGILVSRVFYVALSVLVARRYAAVFQWSRRDVRELLSTFVHDLKWRKYYAADSVVTASFAQLDIILVNYFFGMHLSGVYQVGAKVTQISLAVVQVFSSTYIPAISQALHGAQRDERVASRRLRSATLELFAVGTVFALGMVFVLPFVLHQVFGQKYDEVNVLFLGFGVAVVCRCLAAPFGIALIALDRPKARLIGQIIIASTYTALAAVVFPRFGFSQASVVMAASLGTALLFYTSRTYRAAPSLVRNAFFPS